MAASVNTNFIVQNGLTVGPLVIDAATGSISTTGNISTTGTTTTFINEVVTGNEAVYGNLTVNSTVFVGATANATSFTAPTIVAKNAASAYTQLAIINSTNTGSADLVAYGDNGTDTSGWADMGFTGTTFNDPAYTITYPNDGYVFSKAGSNSYGGNLVLATGELGSVKDVVIGVGSFYSNAVVARFHGNTATGSTITLAGNVLPASNVLYNLGSTTSWWNVLYGKATQAQYADLAENYQADAYYEPGTVVEFGGAQEVTLGTTDSKRVAGVVSTNPAHLMNGGLSGPNVLALALQGRVPTKVIGPVAKGDIMISAGFGYAKVNNDAQAGQIIGKALADFNGAKGMIEVVVGRQ